MDARPTLEQRQLEDAAVRLIANHGVQAVGDLDDAARRSKLDTALEQAGWRELRTGEPGEGPAASGVEAALVARVLARGAADTAFVGPLLDHDLLRRAGVEPDGGPFTIAVTSDLGALATDPAGAVAVDAAGATAALLAVPDGAGFRLATAAIGEPTTTVDLTRAVAQLAGPATPIDGASLTADDLLAWESLAVALTAADLVGAMEGAITLAVDYARERRQYGAPIGSYQAVQHLLAEAHTLAEGAYSAAVHAAWAADALPPAEARQAAAVAKAYAARAARTVCETSIQVHGGIGNTWECMAHVFLRRSLLATELFGGDGPQLALLAHERLGAR